MKKIPVRQIASGHTLLSAAGQFSIRNLQQVLNGRDLIHDLHKHDFYFVLAVHAGTGVHEIDFIAYPVQDHSVFILRPGQVHRLELSANTQGFLMELDLSFYQPKSTIKEHRWQKASGKNYCAVEAARFERLFAQLTAIYEEYAEKHEGYLEAIKAHLDLFFIEYIRQSRDPHKIARTENGYIQERFEEFMRLLDANIATMKHVTQYATLLSMSPYQLNAITKSSAGKTVSELIDEQIILESKRYLLATPSQIKEIADHLGYEDPSYFIRFFKKHTGYAPDNFRRNFK